MRTINKKLYLLLILLPFCLSGCIWDGEEECDPVPDTEQKLTLRFLHNINPSYSNTISDVIEYIDLYIYTEAGELLEKVYLDKEYLENTNYIYTTILDPGTYKFAIWMNAGESYAHENTENLPDASMRVICNGQQDIYENTPGIYYGYDDKLYDVSYEEQEVTATIAWYPVHKDINFAKNTNHIEIVSKFDRVLMAGTELKTYIAGPNGISNFTNRGLSTCPAYTYYPYQTNAQNNYVDPIYGPRYYYTHTSDFTTQRLWQGDDLELVITYTDFTGYEDELARFKLTDDLIMQNPLYNNNYQLERYDNYRIVFYFDYDREFVITEITVDDWILINQPQEL